MLGSQGRCSIHWNRCFARFESSGLSRDSAVVPRTQFVVLRMYTSRMRCTPPLDVTQVSELLGDAPTQRSSQTVERRRLELDERAGAARSGWLAETFVHGAAAEAGEVERDVRVAEVAQVRDDALAVLDDHRDVRQFDLDAGDIAVVADAELAQPETTQERFGGTDLVKRFDGDGRAVWDA